MNKLNSMIVILVSMLMTAGLSVAGATEVTVYKSPTCGCCKNWVAHMRANGFTVKAVDVADVTPYKIANGVGPTLASCHTAIVDSRWCSMAWYGRWVRETIASMQGAHSSGWGPCRVACSLRSRPWRAPNRSAPPFPGESSLR